MGCEVFVCPCPQVTMVDFENKIAMLLEGGQDVCQIVIKTIRFICKLSELIHAQNANHQE